MTAFAKQMSDTIFHAFLQSHGFFGGKLNKSLTHYKSIKESESFIKNHSVRLLNCYFDISKNNL